VAQVKARTEEQEKKKKKTSSLASGANTKSSKLKNETSKMREKVACHGCEVLVCLMLLAVYRAVVLTAGLWKRHSSLFKMQRTSPFSRKCQERTQK